MRKLAEAPIADPAWIAKARYALRSGAAEWERAQMETLDAWEETAYGQD
ncbi:hypothetical protein [Caulobacter zeae]|nr:hypothetical protein [Caulobacter zeae]